MAQPGSNPAIDNESRFPEIVGILTICSVLSTLAVGLRIYTRGFMIHQFGLDDGTMVFAQIITLSVAVTIGLEAHFGLGKHIWMMPPENIMPYMKTFYASIVIYNFATPLVKISILLQYKRIFIAPVIQRICKCALVFIGLMAISFPLTLALSCIPVEAFWDPSVPGHCIKQHIADPIMGSFNILTDMFLLILPMPLVRSLQLPRKQRWMLYGVFGLSTFTIAIALYRIKPLITATLTTDPTWDNVDAATFSYIEVTIGTMASCLPTLRPLVLRLLPSARDQSDVDSKGYATHELNQRSVGSRDHTANHIALGDIEKSSNHSESPSTSELVSPTFGYVERRLE